MINKTLSKLAADYANGVIDKESYRKSRGELLRGIVAGQIAVDSIDYLPPLALEDEAAVTEPMARNTTQMLGSAAPRGNLQGNITSPPPSPKKNKSSTLVYIAVSSGIVILLIAAVVMFYPKPPAVQTQKDIGTAAITPPVTNTVSSKAGEDLIAAFLNTNIWTEETLNDFLQAWNTLSAEEQTAAVSTKRMQRLSASIYKQFLEERALASIDSEKAIQRQQMLINFARSIGIEDTRMVID